MDGLEFEAFKAGAILRSYYFDLYARFEREIRIVFESCLSSVDATVKNKLYFYLGSNHMLKFGLEYADEKANGTHKKFNASEFFRDFQTAKIIKLSKKDKFIPAFNFNITSLNRSTIEIPFYDAVIKLINMRNILAHEPKDFKFTEQEHIIETLSLTKINDLNSFNLDGYSFKNSENSNIEIISNLIYMKMLISKIKLSNITLE